MKGDYRIYLTESILQHTAREIGNNYKLNVQFLALCLSMDIKVERTGCAKCINDAMNLLSKKTGIKRRHGRKKNENKNGKISSA